MSKATSKEITKQLKIMRGNFKNLHVKNGWSFEELSEISGIKTKILTEIENGQDFDVHYLIKLCQIYGIKPHNIFSPII